MLITFKRAMARAHGKEEDGASGVEYGLLVAAIAAVIVLVVFAVGTYVHGAFHQTCDAIQQGGGVAVDANGAPIANQACN